MSAESTLRKFDYIDILRGMAILGVLAVHSHQEIAGLSQGLASVFDFGQMGVQLFFVASAVTLCLSMSSRPHEPWHHFFLRRVFRIAPLYYAGIVLYFVWRLVAESLLRHEFSWPPGYSISAVVENLFFVHGLHLTHFNFVVPGGWSISAEMLFYALFPWLFTLQSKWSVRRLAAATVAVALASLVIQLLLVHGLQPWLQARGKLNFVRVNDHFGFLYATLLNQIGVFMVGILTFRCLHRRLGPRHVAAIAALLAASWLVQNATYRTGVNGFFYPLLAAAAFGLLTIKMSQIDTFRGPVVAALVHIGRLSFSMYILHFVLLDLLRIAYSHSLARWSTSPNLRLAVLTGALIVVTYLAARLTHRLIEAPGIEFGRRVLNRMRRAKAAQVPAFVNTRAGSATG